MCIMTSFMMSNLLRPCHCFLLLLLLLLYCRFSVWIWFVSFPYLCVWAYELLLLPIAGMWAIGLGWGRHANYWFLPGRACELKLLDWPGTWGIVYGRDKTNTWINVISRNGHVNYFYTPRRVCVLLLLAGFNKWALIVGRGTLPIDIGQIGHVRYCYWRGLGCELLLLAWAPMWIIVIARGGRVSYC